MQVVLMFTISVAVKKLLGETKSVCKVSYHHYSKFIYKKM